MTDREAIIKGLERFAECMLDNNAYCSSDCALFANGVSCVYVVAPLIKDALALLKEREASYDFLDWLACSVVLADDFETNPGFYREVICRKLVRLGMLKLEGDRYVLPDPEKWRGEVTEDAN